MAARLPPEIEREVLLCKNSQREFDKHVKIQDKQTRLLVPLTLNDAQRRLEESLDLCGNKWLYDLKARQLGSTTYLLCRGLRKSLLIPGHQAGVVAHTHDAVTAIFRIAHRVYEHLPKFLRVPTTSSSANELVFAHGGRIRVTTASSESFRGQTYDSLLCSEFSNYSNPKEALAAILNTATPNAEVALETTAKGLNHAYDLWQDPRGYARVFLSWRLDPHCRLDRLPSGVVLDAAVRDYAKQHALSPQEANWVAFILQTKCAGDWSLLNQEYPVTPEVAFVTSGSRVFGDLSFPDAQSYPGYLELEPPQPGHVYTLGADAASGSPNGDNSAFVVLDVTDRSAVRIAATQYARTQPMEFAQQVHKAATRYGAMAVIESNYTGCVVLEYLVRAGHALIYRTFNPLHVGQEASSTLGFHTSAQTRPVIVGRLHTHLRTLHNLDREPRIQHEVNTFVYDNRGNPGHDSGKHDDLLFALGLALAGMDQIAHVVQNATWKRRPVGMQEVVQWEARTGLIYEGRRQEFADDELRDAGFSPQSLLDVLGR